MRRLIAPLAVVALIGLAGCQKTLQAPTDAGVCWHLAAIKDGKGKFNQVAAGQPDMEHCAGQLEAMRLNFLHLGGTNQEIVGAYQGSFLFLRREGVFTSTRYDGAQFPFMVRTGDGRLAIPGAMPMQNDTEQK